MQACDVLIVGGGIVGLATALALTERYPHASVTVLEKEAEVARHQTGHNSGVVHAGIYYKPGSLKARLCVEGVRLMHDFCQAHDLTLERCGKVIVATTEAEIPRLEELYRRGQANGVQGLRMLDAHELRDLEPHATGLRAVHSPTTSIVDFAEVARAMVRRLQERGGRLQLASPALAVASDTAGVAVTTPQGVVRASYLINCAGLYSDRLARMSGLKPPVRIIPFRGEYYFLKPERRHLVRGLIYPVPDPALPFLGVHFTRTVHGEIEAGPNAVFAFAREGYTYGDIRPREVLESLSYRGFWRISGRFWRVGLYEYYRSLNKRAFVRSLQKLVPAITEADVVRGHAGVRAQAIDPQGNLADDFVIQRSEHALHVLNAPSPAATASLAIGRYLAQQITLP
jgi:L-2-hydroxyglutarate oxidase